MKSQSKKDEGPIAISGLMNGVLKKIGLQRRFQESQIKKDWEKWVGPTIAKHATPYRVINKKLVIYVDNSVWLADLTRFHQRTILNRLQKEVGSNLITEIFFKIGEAPKD